MSNTDPISKILAPRNAVIPPPYRISVGKVLEGWREGRKTKKALNTLGVCQDRFRDK
jgi:hypothetical protein